MTLADELAAHLNTARGEVTRARHAARLGMARATLTDLEEARGNPTLARVEEVGRAYGLEFHLTATVVGQPAGWTPKWRPFRGRDAG